MSSDLQQLNVEVLSWREARDLVIPVNPGLAAQIDQLDPSDDLKLVKATYNFGDTIREGGQFYLPTKTGTVEIHDANVPRALQEMLITDTTMPTGITLDKCLEVDIVFENRQIVFGLMKPGRVFGLWGMLRGNDQALYGGRDWNVTAGARSIAILPKISDATSFQRLKEAYHLGGEKPKDFTEQWKLFSNLSLNISSEKCWTITTLYFSNIWRQKLDDPAWLSLRGYLYELGWNSITFLRDNLIFETALSNILVKCNLKPSPYLVDTIQHLYAMSVGDYPGFEFAFNDTLAPISFLQDAFANIYGLTYLPSIIQPSYVSHTDPMRPVYYSLEWPTSIKSSPKSYRLSTKLTDLREIQHILNITLNEILKHRSDVADSKIYQIADKLSFKYYHPDFSKHRDICDTSQIPCLDKTLLAEKEKYNLDFCASSALIRGCIRIGIK